MEITFTSKRSYCNFAIAQTQALGPFFPQHVTLFLGFDVHLRITDESKRTCDLALAQTRVLGQFFLQICAFIFGALWLHEGH